MLEPLALDREVTEVLMEGGGELPVYDLRHAGRDCLNPAQGTRDGALRTTAFRARVAGLLRDLLDAVRAGHRAARRRRWGW